MIINRKTTNVKFGSLLDDIIREATAYKMMSDILFERGRLCGSSFVVEDDDSNCQKLLRQVFS